MRRIKRFICKLFGHRWAYWTSGFRQLDIRCCKCCKDIQQYFNPLQKEWKWTSLVERTKLGANEWLEKRNIR